MSESPPISFFSVKQADLDTVAQHMLHCRHSGVSYWVFSSQGIITSAISVSADAIIVTPFTNLESVVHQVLSMIPDVFKVDDRFIRVIDCDPATGEIGTIQGPFMDRFDVYDLGNRKCLIIRIKLTESDESQIVQIFAQLHQTFPLIDVSENTPVSHANFLLNAEAVGITLYVYANGVEIPFITTKLAEGCLDAPPGMQLQDAFRLLSGMATDVIPGLRSARYLTRSNPHPSKYDGDIEVLAYRINNAQFGTVEELWTGGVMIMRFTLPEPGEPDPEAIPNVVQVVAQLPPAIESISKKQRTD
jgi:hypothetical protein